MDTENLKRHIICLSDADFSKTLVDFFSKKQGEESEKLFEIARKTKNVSKLFLLVEISNLLNEEVRNRFINEKNTKKGFEDKNCRSKK